MRSLNMPLVSCVLLAALGSEVRAETFRDAVRHYSFEAPAAWRGMPPQEIKAISDNASKATKQEIVYQAGFRAKFNAPEGYPYMLVQAKDAKTAGTSYEELERFLAKDFNKEVEKAAGSLSDIAKNLSVGSVAFDRATNRIIMRMQIDVAGVGRIQGLSVGHLGSHGIVFLHCYARDGDFQAQLPTFNQINDSFRFDEGFKFTPGAGGVLGGAWEGAWKKGLAGAVGGGVLGLIAYLFNRKPKPKKKKRKRRMDEDDEEEACEDQEKPTKRRRQRRTDDEENERKDSEDEPRKRR